METRHDVSPAPEVHSCPAWPLPRKTAHMPPVTNAVMKLRRLQECLVAARDAARFLKLKLQSVASHQLGRHEDAVNNSRLNVGSWPRTDMPACLRHVCFEG